MKEFKGTKGEWKVIHEINVTSKSNRAICACGSYDSREKSSQDINKANAKLISAAPKLLEALIKMVEWHGKYEDHECEMIGNQVLCNAEDQPEIIQVCLKAINKALD